jgi:ubiquinone biosynthesis protein
MATVLSRHGFAPALQRLPVLRQLLTTTTEQNAAQQRSTAERFASVLEELGPSFVKLGQILSTRGDVLPPDWVAALSHLQDQVPPFPFVDVHQALCRAWSVSDLHDRIRSIDEHPLASASMAQVHCATLLDGTAVVIKVRRPGVVEQVAADADVLDFLATVLEWAVNEASQLRARDWVLEFQAALQQELDFDLERRHLDAFGHAHRDRSSVHIPHTYPALSANDVLVMERIHGRRITDLAGTEQAAPMAQLLVEVMFDQVYADGLFHGDPHPGNLLVDNDGRLAMIDFGLVGRLPRETQDRLLMVLVALALRDADALSRLVLRIGQADGRVDMGAFRAEVAKLLGTYAGLAIHDVSSAAVLADLIHMATRFGIRLPRELAVLAKASASIDGIVRTLHPTFNPTQMLSARAEKLLRARIDPRNIEGGGLRSALQLALVVQELPLQLGQALMDLERGTLQVTVKSGDLDGLQRSLRGLAMTVCGGILAGAFILGGMQALPRSELAPYTTIIAIAAFVAAGMLMGIALGWYVTGGVVPKLSLRRWLPRSRR